jgi:hypothetical protein
MAAVERIDQRWAICVAAFVALSIADMALTARLMGMGASELNPVMAAMVDTGWWWAIAFKAAVTSSVAVGLWLARDHRIVRATGLGFVALLGAIVAYQVLNLGVA